MFSKEGAYLVGLLYIDKIDNISYDYCKHSTN